MDKEKSKNISIIEVSIIIAFLLNLFIFGIIILGYPPPKTPEQVVKAMSKRLECALFSYQAEYGHYPDIRQSKIVDSLGKYIDRHRSYISPDNKIIDPWKTPYQLLIENDTIIFCSAGPDKLFCTDDDIEINNK